MLIIIIKPDECGACSALIVIALSEDFKTTPFYFGERRSTSRDLYVFYFGNRDVCLRFSSSYAAIKRCAWALLAYFTDQCGHGHRRRGPYSPHCQGRYALDRDQQRTGWSVRMLSGDLSHQEVQMINHQRCLTCGRRRKPSHEKHAVRIEGCNERWIDARIAQKYKDLEPRRVGA